MTFPVDNLLVEKLMTIHGLCKSILQVTTSLNGTTNLSNTSESAVVLSGTATGHSIVLPNATTLVASDGATDGWWFEIYNATDQVVAIKYNNGTSFFTLAQQSAAYLLLSNGATQNGVWRSWQVLLSSVATGIINYTLAASTVFSTGSTTDVLITGFSVTPQAGTYICLFNGASYLTTTPKAHWWSLYRGGVQIADSERTQDTAHSNQNMVDTTMTMAYFDGTQACDVRVRTSNGTLTMNARTLTLIRLGV